MATAAPSQIPPITYCAPGAAKNARLDLFTGGTHRVLPVQEAAFNADGDAKNNNIDWSDFGRMQTQRHKLNCSRVYETPTWAMNDPQLRAVIVHYVERRAGFQKIQPGPEMERLKRAEARLAARLPKMDADLTRHCQKHLELKRGAGDVDYIRKFGEEIEALDTALRVDKNITGIALRVATLYWRQGWDSVATAQELSLKPPHVRRTLWCLRAVAARLGFAPAPRHRPGAHGGKPIPAPIRLCVQCGAPRPFGRGQRFCLTCSSARRAARKAGVKFVPKLVPSARAVIVSSPEFIALFEAARRLMRDPNRKRCKWGHPICAANAHVGDLRRTGKYSCNECWKEQAARYLQNAPK